MRVPIEVDVGEVVVGPDLLDLPQRVLQRPPVPQPDVVQCLAVAGEVEGLHGGLGGERALLHLVEGERHPREADVVGDVRALPDELVRLHHEAGHVPRRDRQHDVDEHRRRQRGHQPHGPAEAKPIHDRDDRAQHQRGRHPEHPRDEDRRLGVAHAREHGVVVEEAVEAREINTSRHHEQQHAQRQRDVTVAHPAARQPEHRPAGLARPDEGAEGRHERDDRHGGQPPERETEDREREQVERDRPTEDRIDRGEQPGRFGRVQEERHLVPVLKDGRGGDKRDQRRQHPRNDLDHGLEREPDRLVVDVEDALREGTWPDEAKDAEQQQERERRHAPEKPGLVGDGGPEDVAEAQRVEPQLFDVPGDQGPRAEEHQQDQRGNREPSPPAAPASHEDVTSSAGARKLHA